ncbi:MAG: response regulator [Desulfobacteraceae bacterium]|nr:response regulator [Desulfobacteraceae bacterium]
MGNNPIKILVTDDEAFIRRVLEVKLKKRGYEVQLAKNGLEGYNLIKSYRPDVVISDINMPVMDGKEFAIKSEAFKKDRPFLTIIITARIKPDDHYWINDLTDTIFMEKPFSPSKLVDEIEKYLGDKG